MTVTLESKPKHINSPEREGIDGEQHLTDIELVHHLPGLMVIGHGNPVFRDDYAPLPEILFHAYRGDGVGDSFAFDEYYQDGTKAGVNNQIMGAGLYCGNSELAELYKKSFGENGHIEPIIPNQARIIDMTSDQYKKEHLPREFYLQLLDFAILNNLQDHPEMVEPVSFLKAFRNDRIEKGGVKDGFITNDDIEEFVSEYAKYSATKGQDKQALEEKKAHLLAAAKRINTILLASIFSNQKYAGISLRDFSGNKLVIHDGKNAPLDKELVKKFLQSIGVDGIKFSMYPSVDSGKLYDGFVFWRYDRVGTRKVWQHRGYQAAGVHAAGSALRQLSEEELTNIDMYQNKKRTPNELLYKDKEIGRQSGIEIKNRVDNEALLDSGQGKRLWEIMLHRKIDPYSVVSFMAEQNDDLATLLSAEVGVWEGYRLHEHTQAVMNQLERFFAQHIHSGEPNQALFSGIIRLGLFLQDMGKPLAVSIENSRANQAVYNKAVAQNILSSMPIGEDVKELIIDLISQNHVGAVIENPDNLDSSAKQIAEIYKKYKGKFDPRDIATIMMVMHLCDASAYTSQAVYRDARTGHPKKTVASLDHLFVIGDRADQIKLKPKNNKIKRALLKKARELSQQ